VTDQIAVCLDWVGRQASDWSDCCVFRLSWKASQWLTRRVLVGVGYLPCSTACASQSWSSWSWKTSSSARVSCFSGTRFSYSCLLNKAKTSHLNSSLELFLLPKTDLLQRNLVWAVSAISLVVYDSTIYLTDITVTCEVWQTSQ